MRAILGELTAGKNVALSYVYANSGCVAASWLCVACELVCVCVSLVRVVIICPASRPIPRWCPVRAWLFFTFYLTYLLCV